MGGRLGPAAPQVVRRRPYVGAPFELSQLAFSVVVRDRVSDAGAAVALLRRALDAGVTTFDTVDTPDPALAEALLGQAFPQGDPHIVVITPATSSPARTGRFLPGERTPFGSPGGPSPSPDAPASLPGRFHRLYEVDASAGRAGSLDGPAPPRGTARPDSATRVVRCRTVEEAVDACHAVPRVLASGSFSLLDRSLASDTVRKVGADHVAWVARDPFAGGRLDGSRFVVAGSPVLGPSLRSVRDLDAEFAPVRPYGFLSRPGARTLAQASLRYVADREWVATTCVPLPTPDRWHEIVGFASAPALTDDERRAVEELPVPDGLPGPPGGRGS